MAMVRLRKIKCDGEEDLLWFGKADVVRLRSGKVSGPQSVATEMTSGGAPKSEPNGIAFAGAPLKPDSTAIDVERVFCITILPNSAWAIVRLPRTR
jgi:hypothetical protein